MAADTLLSRPSHPPAMASNPKNGKAVDFTKRKRWADTLIDELPGVLLIVCDPLGEIVFCNPASRELLNWGDDIFGMNLDNLMHPEDAQPFKNSLESSIRTGTELVIYVRLSNRYPFVGSDNATGPDAKFQWPLYEIKGHPHFTHSDKANPNVRTPPDCRYFFLAARPHPTYGTQALDGFLELKLEQERLTYLLQELEGTDGRRASSGDSKPFGLFSARTTSSTAPVNDPAPLSLPGSGQSNPFFTSMASQASFHRSSLPDFGDVPSSLNPTPRLPSDRRHTIGESSHMAEILHEDPSKPELSAKKDIMRRKRKSSTVEKHVCMSCGRTDSPEWRKGPLGPKTLCNACGLRHTKKQKKVEEVREADEQQTTPDPPSAPGPPVSVPYNNTQTFSPPQGHPRQNSSGSSSGYYDMQGNQAGPSQTPRGSFDHSAQYAPAQSPNLASRGPIPVSIHMTIPISGNEAQYVAAYPEGMPGPSHRSQAAPPLHPHRYTDGPEGQVPAYPQHTRDYATMQSYYPAFQEGGVGPSSSMRSMPPGSSSGYHPHNSQPRY